MTPTISYAMNLSDTVEVADHLAATDERFKMDLEKRIPLSEYAAKITSRAERFEAWGDRVLVGLVAAYASTDPGGTFFITNVSVRSSFEGRGIATRLMKDAISYAAREHAACVALEVRVANVRAMSLYAGLGFEPTTSAPTHGLARMELDGPLLSTEDLG